MLVVTKNKTKNCLNKTFVMTNICRDKHNFVATKVLFRQAYFCRDKTSVATKMIFVATPANEMGLGDENQSHVIQERQNMRRICLK